MLVELTILFKEYVHVCNINKLYSLKKEQRLLEVYNSKALKTILAL